MSNFQGVLYYALFIGNPAQQKRFFKEVHLMTLATQIFGVISWLVLYLCLPTGADHNVPATGAVFAGMMLGSFMTAFSRTLTLNILAGAVSVFFLSLGFRVLLAEVEDPTFWVLPIGLIITLTSAPIFNGVLYYNAVSVMTWMILGWDYFPDHSGRADALWPAFTMAASLLIGFVINLVFLLLRMRNFNAEQELQTMAFKDALTGMNNRRMFTQSALAMLEDGNESQLNFLMIDIDNFKKINDQLGHDVGDEVLKKVGGVIAEQSGPHLCARLGGEEFAIVHSGDRASVCSFAEGILKKMQAVALPDRGVTVSIGVARLLKNVDLAVSYKLADDLLYQAKQNGKNRYELASNL
ncbi:GGDEF domain-containing protein [Duganella sp. PWIR1]